MGAKKIEIEKEELVRLKEKGMTYVAIAQYLSEHGKSVSQATIFNRIRDYYNQASKEGRESNEQSSLKEKHETDKPVSWEKLYSKLEDNMIMEILMHGMTIEEYSKRLNRPEHKENLQKRFKKFRFVVEHDEKIKDKWLADQNLLEVVDRVESLTDHPKERYIRMIERIIGGNKCQHGNIDLIKYHVFKDNQDLMAYILSDSELSYGDYDLAVWNHTKKSYEEKIKRIFSRMHKIEMGIEKREKNSKKPIKEGQER